MSNTITVLGVGRLGLGLALLLDKGGYDVCGVDINPEYVKSLNDRTYKTKEPDYESLLEESKRFHTTTKLEVGLRHSDIIFIVVQTPNGGGDKFYDHTILSNLLMNINQHKVHDKHIIIGCTVMPKYIDIIGKTLISDCVNTTLNYNPEFIAQGEIIKGFLNPDIILLGTDTPNVLGPRIQQIYSSFVESVPKYCILSPLEAEIVKIGINGFITTKLSFANMLSDACDECGADKSKVLSAIGSDSRIGTKYFKPGYSFGGPCFPRDTKAIQQFIEQCKINSELLVATTKYNEEHTKYQITQFLSKLDELRSEDGIIEFTDVCYKEKSKIPIIEESAKLKIAKGIVDAGHVVRIRDESQLIHEVKKQYGSIFIYSE